MKRQTSDPIIDEIYAIREAHAAEFGYDLKAMFDDARQKGVLEKHRRVESLRNSEQMTKTRIAATDLVADVNLKKMVENLELKLFCHMWRPDT